MQKNKNSFIAIPILLLTLAMNSWCQVNRPSNLPRFDEKRIHFGFLVGLNSMNNHYHLKHGSPALDTITGVSIEPRLGLQVGILSDLKLFEYANLRLMTNIVFGERTYLFYGNPRDKDNGLKSMPWESVYLQIPLHLKIRAKRWKDFRPYLIGGIQYTFDFSSLRKIEPHEEDAILVRLKDNDFLSIAGVGFDFYLPYFKFAIELTTSSSMQDVLIHENTRYANSLAYLKSHFFSLTLTFE